MDKILVVDDENINLMMVSRILSDGYDVKTVQSGEEALMVLKDFTPNLILLDIHMPGIDGFETLINIRQIEHLSRIPVIFLTADDDSDAEVKGFEMGGDDFIRKPFVSAVVKRRVERSIENFRLHQNLQSEVNRLTQKAENRRKELEVMSVEIIETLASAIDAKDIYTKGHSSRVADYSALLARKLGWDENRVEKLTYKAILHDVGKIGVPDRVLNKAGRLTLEEFEVIKSHTTIGAELLKGVSSLSNMYKVARNHHERYDGKGYPDGLKGQEIPEEARLVGIADAYDAMSSDRVYRKALPDDVIREELVKGRGTQFDPEMLDAFLELYDEGKLDINTMEVDIQTESSDISDVVTRMIQESSNTGSLKLESDEMSKIYKYIYNVRLRSGIEYNTVLITLTWEGDLSEKDMLQAMKAMEYSISQSLRKVDISTKVSGSQYLLVLTEAYYENVQMIVDRIFAGFYRNSQNINIKPIYEIKTIN